MASAPAPSVRAAAGIWNSGLIWPWDSITTTPAAATRDTATTDDTSLTRLLACKLLGRFGLIVSTYFAPWKPEHMQISPALVTALETVFKYILSPEKAVS